MEYTLVGVADDELFARAELLAELLSRSLPNFAMKKVVVSQERWAGNDHPPTTPRTSCLRAPHIPLHNHCPPCFLTQSFSSFGGNATIAMCEQSHSPFGGYTRHTSRHYSGIDGDTVCPDNSQVNRHQYDAQVTIYLSGARGGQPSSRRSWRCSVNMRHTAARGWL